MPRTSDWTGGLLPHELGSGTSDKSGLTARASEEGVATTSRGPTKPIEAEPFDQPDDDPRGLPLEALRQQTHVG